VDWLRLTHQSAKIQMMRRMAGREDISALRTLASVVEPVKDYTRMNSLKGPWDFRAPLNRQVDAADPESEEARKFAELVQRYAQSGYTDKAREAQIWARLIARRDNDAKLHPLLEESFLLKELAPISQDLSALGSSGLQALDYLDGSEHGPEAWRTQQLTTIDWAATPKADLLLMVVAPVRQLIDASAGQTKR
jgi:hexosaminidase